MATPSIAIFPSEVTTHVFTQLVPIPKDLASCSLVNQLWHELATPLLYRTVALKQNNIGLFCTGIGATKYGKHVRSLTVSFLALHPSHLRHLADIVPLLPQFTNLSSFSFWLAGSGGVHATLTHRELVELVDALPQTCRNIELDALGYDVRNPWNERDDPHLCDSIRKVIPRMEHVRLRLRACKALFVDPEGQMISLPNIKTFIFNCSYVPGIPLPTCRCTDIHPTTTYNSPDLLWHTITTSLEKLVLTPNAVQKTASIYAFMTTKNENDNHSSWNAYLRADMQSQSSLVLPYRIRTSLMGTHPIGTPYVMRLWNGLERTASIWSCESIAEGPQWCEVVGGARIPAAVLADEQQGKANFATGCVKKEIKSRQMSRYERNKPDTRMTHWQNEQLTRRTLVSAEERVGRDEYLSLRPITEITPQGWERMRNGILKKIQG